MIEQTFIHLPGIGPTRERLLWERGISSWETFESALRSGVLPRLLFSAHRNVQLSLFLDEAAATSGNGREVHSPQSPDSRVNAWLDDIDLSRRALFEEDYSFFLERLNPSEHWRILPPLINDALYLDIETTGLSIDFNYVTVIGALHRSKFYQWVWPEPVDELIELMRRAPLVVTFNGRRFDVPFIRHWAASVPGPRAHVDLLYLARSLGIDGGLKMVEKRFGLARHESISGMDGSEAVVMWCKALWGDKDAYRRLLLYNRADVEMLPKLAALLCQEHTKGTHVIAVKSQTTAAHRPARFSILRQAWELRRSGLHLLTPKLVNRLGRPPVVVGIDLRGNPKNPTGWCRCEGSRVESQVLHDDDEIVALTLSARPDLVSIDAPLSLPRGRSSVSDDSPCREKGGIVRDAERILWSRGIPVYPSLIRHMQGLTQRGITLAARLRESGVAVVESYPGAAQDILGIPRKRVDLNILCRGLTEFGFETRDGWSHDELDALTSALVGYFYLADEYEAIGADDEGYMIIPRWTAAMRWISASGESPGIRRAVCVLGAPSHVKSALLRAIDRRLGWPTLALTYAFGRDFAESSHSDCTLNSAEVNSALAELVQLAGSESRSRGLVLDGLPQNEEQVRLAGRLFDHWSLIYLRSATMSTNAYCGIGPKAPSGPAKDNAGESIQAANKSSSKKPGATAETVSAVYNLACDENLREALKDLADIQVIELDTMRSVEELEEEVIQRLLSTRLT